MLSKGDVEFYFVITSDHSLEPPTAQYCQAVKDNFGLTMPVLYDPMGAFLSAIGTTSTNSNAVVLGRGAEIVFKQKYDWSGALDAVDALLQ